VTNEIDKDQLYGRFQRQEDWRTKLHQRVTHKSLDMPETDDVHVDNSRSGLDWKGLAVIVGGLAIGAPWISSLILGSQQHGQPAPNPPAQVSPADSEYDVLFYDATGKPINIPHVSQRRKQ